MKIILLHSDYIEFAPKKEALKDAEKVEKKLSKVKECLVVLSAVEKQIVKNYVKEIKNVAKQVKAKTIVLYPWVHLTDKPSNPKTALKILKDAEDILKKDYKVARAPFGWYKEFSIKVKGHPLSELSRDIKVKDKVKSTEEEAIKAEEKAMIAKKLYVLDTNGKLIEAKKVNFNKYPSLKIFYDYETKGLRKVLKEPAHIELMRKMELVDYEPGSDSGNFRWYPKGVLIKRLLEKHVTDMVVNAGAMEVETPIMYDYEHPALAEYLTRFPARQYKVLSDDKKFFLRFSACFGQYLMKHDMTISYKNLPLRMYELTHYSFRREQRGELAGLKRLRTFTMPDMHTLCKDFKQAKEEFKNQYKLSMKFLKSIDMNFDVAIRTQKDFYYENEDFFKELSKIVKKPILLEMFSERYAYFIMKFEFSVNDSINKASTLSTVQIDVENTERFDITYTNKKGKQIYPLMLHASISGGIDRDLHSILEAQAINQQRGKKPMLPLWLSPTQVRVVPVSEKYLDFAEKIVNEIEKENIRVDFDDRELHVGKKIREAEKEWTPFIIVVGEREKESGNLAVRIRETGKVENMKPEKLTELIKEKTKGMPFRPLPLSRELSKRPKFVG